MAGWDGSGNYVLRYTFVNDAAAGIDILAARQDQMWTDLQTGIENCLTLDGQTKPTQNIDWNAKKITNVAAGTAATDVPQFQQIAAAVSEWFLETSGLTYISTTSFKVLGSDKTTTYAIGRRLKLLVTAGTVYGTVTASSFSTDTTVTIKEAVLDSGLSAAYFGLLAPTNPSAPSYSNVAIQGLSSVVSLSSGAYVVLVRSSTLNDTLGEISGNTFVPKVTGVYDVEAAVLVQSNAATTGFSGNDVFVTAHVGGVAQSPSTSFSWPFANSLSRAVMAPFKLTLSLTAGQVLDLRATTTFTGTAPVAGYSGLTVRRLS